MQIYGNHYKPMTEIEFRLHSVNTTYRHYMIPLGIENYEPDRESRACIEFQDSREIDLFIDMLVRFRDGNKDYIGVWRE